MLKRVVLRHFSISLGGMSSLCAWTLTWWKWLSSSDQETMPQQVIMINTAQPIAPPAEFNQYGFAPIFLSDCEGRLKRHTNSMTAAKASWRHFWPISISFQSNLYAHNWGCQMIRNIHQGNASAMPSYENSANLDLREGRWVINRPLLHLTQCIWPS